MRFYFKIALFLFSVNLWAQELGFKVIPATYFNDKVNVERVGQKILLKGASCSLLLSEAEAIGKWAKISDSKSKVECVCEESAGCSIDVLSISPQILKNKQSVCMLKDGPNCWNASLNAAGLTDSLRYSTPEEMKFWMESPLCTERGADEAPEAGDVIAIRSSWGDYEVHGFTYLSENLSFSKNGYKKKAPYTLQDPNHVYKVYEVPKKCRGIYQAPKNSRDCPKYSNIFKCISLDEYLETKELKNHEQYSLLEDMKELECKTTETLATGEALSHDVTELMLVSMQSVKKLATQNLKKAKDENEKFFWKIIEIRSEALTNQILQL